MLRRLPVLAALLAFAAAAPAAAAWPGNEWGDPGFGPGPPSPSQDGPDPREGQVSVDHFLAPGAAAALRQTQASVRGAPGNHDDERISATFQAAVVDQLIKAGYDTIHGDAKDGLVTEVREGREMIEPPETRHSPVSGEMAAGVSNYGSMLDFEVSVDLSKPKKALLDTRLEAIIVDRVTGQRLWEGRADIITRDGDPHWNDTAIAGRLAAALFNRFPGPDAPATTR